MYLQRFRGLGPLPPSSRTLPMLQASQILTLNKLDLKNRTLARPDGATLGLQKEVLEGDLSCN